MIPVIFILILSSQTINSTEKVWDLNSPLIVNKKGSEIFFPSYIAEKPKSDSSQDSTIIYKEPEDTTTSTYIICKDEADPAKTKSTLLEKNTELRCPMPGIRIYRQLVVDGNKEAIQCTNQNVANSNYLLYSRLINLNIDQTTYKFVFYHYCYNKNKTMGSLYGYYDVDNPSLLDNKLLAEEQEYKFEMLKPVPSTPNDPPPKIKLLAYYEEPTKFEAVEVVTSAFAPFGHWIRAFHHWPNSAPMFKELAPVWKLLVKNIRQEISKKKEPIKVYSGVSPFIDINVPLSWWIVLYNKDKTHGVSFIMQNYVYKTEKDKVAPLCKKSVCGKVGLKGAIPRGKDYPQAFIYCCPPSTIAESFGFQKGNNLLMFTDKEPLTAKAQHLLRQIAPSE